MHDDPYLIQRVKFIDSYWPQPTPDSMTREIFDWCEARDARTVELDSGNQKIPAPRGLTACGLRASA